MVTLTTSYKLISVRSTGGGATLKGYIYFSFLRSNPSSGNSFFLIKKGSKLRKDRKNKSGISNEDCSDDLFTSSTYSYKLEYYIPINIFIYLITLAAYIIFLYLVKIVDGIALKVGMENRSRISSKITTRLSRFQGPYLTALIFSNSGCDVRTYSILIGLRIVTFLPT